MGLGRRGHEAGFALLVVVGKSLVDERGEELDLPEVRLRDRPGILGGVRSVQLLLQRRGHRLIIHDLDAAEDGHDDAENDDRW